MKTDANDMFEQDWEMINSWELLLSSVWLLILFGSDTSEGVFELQPFYCEFFRIIMKLIGDRMNYSAIDASFSFRSVTSWLPSLLLSDLLEADLPNRRQKWLWQQVWALNLNWGNFGRHI